MAVNIIVAFPRLDDAKNVKNILIRNGYNVAAVCTTGAQTLSIADGLGSGIIVCAYKLADVLCTEISECMPPGFELLVLVSKQHRSDLQGSGIMSVPMPLCLSDFYSTIEMMVMAANRRRRENRLKPRIRSDEERQIINSAKLLLIERNGFTEDEAHKYIQRCSMESGINLVESAQMILTMYGTM